MIAVSWDQTGKIYNLDDGSIIATITGHTGKINSCDIKNDDSEIVTASDDLTIKFWTNLGVIKYTISASPYKNIFVSYSPDN